MKGSSKPKTLHWMLLTSPVKGDGGGDDSDPSQDGDDGQNHGVAAQAASSIDVALLQTVSGLNRVKTEFWSGFVGFFVISSQTVCSRTITEKVSATMLIGHSGQKQDRMARIR